MSSQLKSNVGQELLADPVRVAVLGSGGREHALAAKIKESPLCRELFVLPGNEGMRASGLRTVKVDFKDHARLIEELRSLEVEFVVVGPDDLLAAGIVDVLEAEGFIVFGPKKLAARIESSKAFAKEMMTESGIPTAKHLILGAEDIARVEDVAAELGGFPIVLKYDGLALGKGVRICVDSNDAVGFLHEVFNEEKFSRGSKAKPKVVAEQFLSGHEVSVFAVTDGSNYTVLDPVCDHKRLLEGNMGPNTGGMGAYSPVPWLPRDVLGSMAEKIFPKLLERMRESKSAFKGLLYAGLMVRGTEFWVLEFNARFGDPETQALLPRLESDLLPVLYGAATGRLARHLDACPLRWSRRSSVNLVLTSRGYPEKPEIGFSITDVPTDTSDLKVYYAGVGSRADAAGLINSGGRVLNLCGLGETLEHAHRSAVTAAELVQFEGKYFRRDIGSVRSNY